MTRQLKEMGNISSCCFCKSWCKKSEESTLENIVLTYSLGNVNLDENKRKRMDGFLEHQLYEKDRKKSGKLIPENIVLNYSLNNVNLDENELKRMDDFLVHQLYEKEIKQKRSDEELQCITKAVKNIVAKLMTAVGNQNFIFEISDQYLVGSMAEGTSVMEPDEFDFLVVLKHFSKPGAVIFHKIVQAYSEFKMFNSDISVNLLQNKYIKMLSRTKRLYIAYNFLTQIIESEIKSLGSAVEKSNHGTLSIQSTAVCHHGPASVIKLVWKPTFTHSHELDILVDITPCIEQSGIDSVIKASELRSTQTYTYLKAHDTFIMTLSNKTETLFKVSLTTLEVDTVKDLSHHHKQCYMILKYCLNNITSQYKHPFPSFCIKTFVIRHARQCTNIVPDDNETPLSVFTCIMDIFKDICRNGDSFDVDGIFLRYDLPFIVYDLQILTCIDKIVNQLVQLGLNGYSEAHDGEFTEACTFKALHPRVQHRTEYLLEHNKECHLPSMCKRHYKARYIEQPNQRITTESPDNH